MKALRIALGTLLLLIGSLVAFIGASALMDPSGTNRPEDAGTPDPWYVPATMLAVGLALDVGGVLLIVGKRRRSGDRA